jgi:hypothetical protein
MNAIALRFLSIILTIAVLTLVFARLSKRNLVQRVSENIDWLLKVSFFDLVRLIIFIRPLKNYAEQVGIFLWLILVYVVGQYLIVTQPRITEIDGPYIPMIGYVYYLSVLFIVRFVLWLSGPRDEDTGIKISR